MLSLLTTSQIFDIKCNVIQQLMQLLLSRANYVLLSYMLGVQIEEEHTKEDIPNSRLPVKQWNLTEHDQGKTHSVVKKCPWVVSRQAWDSWA